MKKYINLVSFFIVFILACNSLSREDLRLLNNNYLTEFESVKNDTQYIEIIEVKGFKSYIEIVFKNKSLDIVNLIWKDSSLNGSNLVSRESDAFLVEKPAIYHETYKEFTLLAKTTQKLKLYPLEIVYKSLNRKSDEHYLKNFNYNFANIRYPATLKLSFSKINQDLKSEIVINVARFKN